MTHGSLAHWAEWVLPWVVMDGNEKSGNSERKGGETHGARHR
nr:hypothetical protein [Bifidobacterium catenulatum]